MQVHFPSWQDIIPVITGNERLWHSHKINAQWQNLCSKASTATFVKLTPPHPIQKVHYWQSWLENHNKDELCHSCVNNTSILFQWGFWISRKVDQSNGIEVTRIYQCSDFTGVNTWRFWLVYNASAKAFICIFFYKLLFSPWDPNTNTQSNYRQTKHLIFIINTTTKIFQTICIFSFGAGCW